MTAIYYALLQKQGYVLYYALQCKYDSSLLYAL